VSPPAARQLRLRTFIGFVVPAVLSCLTLGPLWWFRVRLPDPVASHFASSSGPPNKSMSQRSTTIVLGAFIAIGFILLASIALRPQISRQVAIGISSTAAICFGVSLMISVLTISSNLDVANWHDAHDAGGFGILAGAGLLLGILAGVSWLTSKLDTTQIKTSSNVRALPLGRTESATWVGTTQSRLPIFPLAMLSKVTVVTGATGLAATMGPLPWPKVRIPLAQIEQVNTLDVNPMQWGGWGYRGSLTLMRQAALVVRKGEGIRCNLRNGKVFVVTVDDATTGAAVLEAHRQRLQTTGLLTTDASAAVGST
jgi:uncharacterized membrane protein